MNLARFLAAELAHNSWAELLQVTLVGFGEEMARMHPDRLTYAADPAAALAAVPRAAAVGRRGHRRVRAAASCRAGLRDRR